MTRLPETVTSKFTDLFAALHYAADDLKIVGQEAMLSGDFSQVTDSMEACKKLQALEADIKAALNSFHAKYPSRLVENSSSSKRDKKRTRKHGGWLRVLVAGRTIEESTIAETFFETLKVFGLERVAKLNKTVTSIPLLSKTQSTSYQTQRQYNGWYVTTHVNKVSATLLLEEIAKALNMPVKVELIQR